MGALGREKGQALPLVVLVLAAALGACGLVAHIGGRVAVRSQISHAADAAALAGALRGEPAAREVAAANGAELASFEQNGDEVAVRVRGRGFTATAHAERVVDVADPAGLPGGDSVGDNGATDRR